MSRNPIASQLCGQRVSKQHKKITGKDAKLLATAKKNPERKTAKWADKRQSEQKSQVLEKAKENLERQTTKLLINVKEQPRKQQQKRGNTTESKFGYEINMANDCHT